MVADKMVETKWYGQNGIRTKWFWTKWYGQNGMDKMVYGQNGFGQNGTDKMVWTKWHYFIFCVGLHFNSAEFNIIFSNQKSQINDNNRGVKVEAGLLIKSHKWERD